MPKSNIYHGVNISELTELERLADGIKGYWLKDWNDCKLTVVRGHALLSTDIMESSTTLTFNLPTHKPFYANILSSNGSRTVLITGNLNISLNAGEQLQAIFTTEK